MDRQWVLSSAEKVDQVLTRSSRAALSSFMQESAVRPIIRPAAPAALQLGSTLRVGTPSLATVIRLEPRTKAAKGIMAATLRRAADCRRAMITRIRLAKFL